MLTILLYALWYMIGVTAFVLWWTTEYDFEVSQIYIALLAGVLGPFAIILGYLIHGIKSEKVIIPKR